MQFKKCIPSQIIFSIKEKIGDYVNLTAPGYGEKSNYGNGAIGIPQYYLNAFYDSIQKPYLKYSNSRSTNEECSIIWDKDEGVVLYSVNGGNTVEIEDISQDEEHPRKIRITNHIFTDICEHWINLQNDEVNRYSYLLDKFHGTQNLCSKMADDRYELEQYLREIYAIQNKCLLNKIQTLEDIDYKQAFNEIYNIIIKYVDYDNRKYIEEQEGLRQAQKDWEKEYHTKDLGDNIDPVSCPRCGNNILKESSTMFCSQPIYYQYHCNRCGETAEKATTDYGAILNWNDHAKEYLKNKR